VAGPEVAGRQLAQQDLSVARRDGRTLGAPPRFVAVAWRQSAGTALEREAT